MAFAIGTTRDSGYCLLWMAIIIENMSERLDGLERSEEVEIGK